MCVLGVGKLRVQVNNTKSIEVVNYNGLKFNTALHVRLTFRQSDIGKLVIRMS